MAMAPAAFWSCRRGDRHCVSSSYGGRCRAICKVSELATVAAPKRLLVREGRYVDLGDAKIRYAEGNSLFIAEFTKKDKNVWLVPASPTDFVEFNALPTYCQSETDPRETWRRMTTIDRDTMSKLVPGLRKAIRVQTSVETLVDGSDELKDAVRVLHILQMESPSGLLYERIREKK